MTTGVDGHSGGAKVSVINDPRWRSLFFQIVLLIAVIWLFWSIVDNTVTNLQERNIASGFGFLGTTSGFSIIQTLIPFSEESSYGRVYVVGLLNTLLVAIVGIFFATVIGFVVGIMRLSKNWLVARIATVYVEVVRNLPLLLQIFFWYFAVLRTLPGPRDSVNIADAVFINNRGIIAPSPIYGEGFAAMPVALLIAVVAAFGIRRWARKRQEATGQQFPVFATAAGLIVGLPLIAGLATGFPVTWDMPALAGFNFKGGFVVIPELISLVLALAIYTASFIAEIVRAGILSVSHGQTEASYALGMRPGTTLRLIIIPQALRVIIPPLTSQYLNLTKNSSLAVAIAYPDLVSVFAGTVLNQTGQAVEVLLMTMLTYLTLSIATSIFMNWYNARIALKER
ncbi:MAG: amino acid ABC transporter permease [Alphaproteobacteria bacterium]|nr:amino acid ABC transporter permease [Alphaproteobacteria bacterium]MDX5370102.1 amino acid ABC transporter permease [Alphaproteobacteria bacterium]